eukprot:1387640-Amorphochlora_amoeboformis.AAC.1
MPRSHSYDYQLHVPESTPSIGPKNYSKRFMSFSEIHPERWAGVGGGMSGVALGVNMLACRVGLSVVSKLAFTRFNLNAVPNPNPNPNPNSNPNPNPNAIPQRRKSEYATSRRYLRLIGSLRIIYVFAALREEGKSEGVIFR